MHGMVPGFDTSDLSIRGHIRNSCTFTEYIVIGCFTHLFAACMGVGKMTRGDGINFNVTSIH